MNQQLSPESRARMIAALPSNDRNTLLSLVDLLSGSENTSGYDDELRHADGLSRAHTGLTIREKEAIETARALTDDTRAVLRELLDATEQPSSTPAPSPRQYTEREIIAASNQDSLHVVERLALHVVGYLALRAWLGSSHLAAGGLEALYSDIASALRSGLKRVDFVELRSVGDDL